MTQNTPFIKSANIHNLSVDILLTKLPQKMVMFAKIIDGLRYMRQRSDCQIVMTTDAFDVILLQNTSTIITKFLSFRQNIVLAAEKMFMPYGPAVNKSIFDSVSNAKNVRYLNFGGFIGYRSALMTFLKKLIHIQNRDSEMCEINVRQCSDQWVGYRFLSTHNWNDWKITLDYNRKIFFCTSATWGMRDITHQLKKSNPVQLHMVFLKAPKVNHTFQVIQKHLFDGVPWTSVNDTNCLLEDEFCKNREKVLRNFATEIQNNMSFNVVCRKFDVCHLHDFEKGLRNYKEKSLYNIKHGKDKDDILAHLFWKEYSQCYYGSGHRNGMNNIWC